MDSRFQWMFNPENDKVLILMRGVSASGKSTRALELAGDNPSVIHSNDHFFGKTKEEYQANWSGERLGLARRQCQKNIRMILQRQLPLAIVDNTNVRVSDMMSYFDMAVQYQYRVKIEEPTTTWWVNDIVPYLQNKEKNRKHLEKMCDFLWKKTLSPDRHEVPLASIKKMMFRYHYNVTVEQLAARYIRDLNEQNTDQT